MYDTDISHLSSTTGLALRGSRDPDHNARHPVLSAEGFEHRHARRNQGIHIYARHAMRYDYYTLRHTDDG
jgi:hypothetical protein